MKKRIIVFTILFTLIFSFSYGYKHEKKYKEKHYQALLCNDLDGVMEYRLLDRSRVDCLTDEYAIEVDFIKKWAESVGQSLYYSEMTNKKAAVGIIVSDNQNDKLQMKRLELLAKKFDIKIFKIKRGE